MLFVKKIEPSCSYCQRGKAVTPDTVLCKKKGVVEAGGHCRAFQYDPLKRVPLCVADHGRMIFSEISLRALAASMSKA